MQAITLDVILRAVFGVRDGERMDLFRERIPPLGELSNPLDWLPFMQRDLGGLSTAARFRKALAKVDELIYAEIADRRAALGADGAGERDDVLSLLLAARHEDGSRDDRRRAARRADDAADGRPRDDRHRALVGVRAAAAHAARAGAAARLARRRRVPRRGRQGDAARAAGGRRRGARAASEPIVLAGYPLPAGTLVLPAIAAVHMRPDLYPEPHEFRPERFLDGGAESYSWIPFGGGVRRCIGASFAQVEMRVVMREVLRRVTPARGLAAARARQGPPRDGGPGARLPRGRRGAARRRAAALRARPARAARRPDGRGRLARRPAPRRRGARP